MDDQLLQELIQRAAAQAPEMPVAQPLSASRGGSLVQDDRDIALNSRGPIADRDDVLAQIGQYRMGLLNNALAGKKFNYGAAMARPITAVNRNLSGRAREEAMAYAELPPQGTRK